MPHEEDFVAARSTVAHESTPAGRVKATRKEDLALQHRWEPREGATRTLLLLHGTGGDENDLIPLGDILDPAANLLSPRGQVTEQGMPRFFRRLAAGVFDMEDLRARTHELADFVHDAAEIYDFDLKSVTAVGFLTVCLSLVLGMTRKPNRPYPAIHRMIGTDISTPAYQLRSGAGSSTRPPKPFSVTAPT